MAITFAATAAVTNGKAFITITQDNNNAQEDVVTTSVNKVGMTKAQVTSLQNQLIQQQEQVSAQASLIAAKLGALASALADNTLV